MSDIKATRPAPFCPVHSTPVPLEFKGTYHGTEHWKCPKCSVLAQIPVICTRPALPAVAP